MTTEHFLSKGRGSVRRGIIGAALLALALTVGCSALQLGYRQTPFLAHWWLDGYVDFEEEQSARVKEALREWHSWHQQTQLKAYVEHLALARALTASNISPQQLCGWNDAARALLVPAIERGLEPAAAVVLTLTAQQLSNIDAQHRKRTEKLREELLPQDASEREEAAVKRNVKRLEDFYGSVTPEQRRLLAETLQRLPVDSAGWMAQRELRHREMLQLLSTVVREKPSLPVVQERLRHLVQRYDGRSPVGGAAQAAAFAAATCQYTAQLHNISTPAQRQHLNKKLRGWETDLRKLMPADQAATTGPMKAAAAPP